MEGAHRHLLVGYAVIALGWTWAMWWTAALVPGLPGGVLFLLFLTGGLGPLLGAAWLVRRGDAHYRRRFLRRVWDPRGVPARWWLALVALASGPALLGAVVADLIGVDVAAPDRDLATVLGVVVFALAAGAVEEPGWRGAAADVWQAGAHPLVVGIGMGVLWAVWHLPLYLVEGSYQHGLGLGSLRFWLTNLALVLLGVLYLWLVNGAGGRILLAILVHAGFNASGELLPRSDLGDLVAVVALAIVTIGVVAATRGRLALRRPAAGPAPREPSGRSR